MKPLAKIEPIDIGIEPVDIENSIEKTSRVLASTYAVYLKTQFYHWNVVGAEFYNLHLMFEEQYKELRSAVDDIAERIRTLGGIAPGTFEEFSKLNFIPEDEESPDKWQLMVRNLEIAHSNISKALRKYIEELEPTGDDVTIDMFTERLKVHEKTAWMLRSLISDFRKFQVASSS